MNSSISSTHLGIFNYCYIRYMSLILYFSAILASNVVKLLEGAGYCHLRAQLNERAINIVFNVKLKWK